MAKEKISQEELSTKIFRCLFDKFQNFQMQNVSHPGLSGVKVLKLLQVLTIEKEHGPVRQTHPAPDLS